MRSPASNRFFKSTHLQKIVLGNDHHDYSKVGSEVEEHYVSEDNEELLTLHWSTADRSHTRVHTSRLVARSVSDHAPALPIQILIGWRSLHVMALRKGGRVAVWPCGNQKALGVENRNTYTTRSLGGDCNVSIDKEHSWQWYHDQFSSEQSMLCSATASLYNLLRDRVVESFGAPSLIQLPFPAHICPGLHNVVGPNKARCTYSSASSQFFHKGTNCLIIVYRNRLNKNT